MRITRNFRGTRNFKNVPSIIKFKLEGKIKKVLYQSKTKTFKELNRLQHQSRVLNAQFSPDGQYILTASSDNTAKVWNLEILEIDFLLSQACQQIEGYLKYNPGAANDRDLCEGVKPVDF